MNRILIVIPILAIASAACAQEPLQVGDLVDLEERVLYKKMADELSKPNPNAPPPAPAIVLPKPPPKPVHRTETLAIYGTSATFYEGQLSMGGKIYPVRDGSAVGDYVVQAVAPHGITLVKSVGGKHTTRGGSNHTLFAPLAR